IPHTALKFVRGWALIHGNHMAAPHSGHPKIPIEPVGALYEEFPEDEITKISSPPPTAEAMGWASMRPKVRDRAALTIVAGPNAGAMYTLGPFTMIGRGKACGIRVDEPVISREHARIIRRGAETYVVEDLRSRNGTFANGVQVQTHQLSEGDRLSFGSST